MARFNRVPTQSHKLGIFFLAPAPRTVSFPPPAYVIEETRSRVHRHEQSNWFKVQQTCYNTTVNEALLSEIAGTFILRSVFGFLFFVL